MRRVLVGGFRLVVLTVGLTISWLIGASVTGLGRPAASAGGAAASAPPASPNTSLALLLLASLIQAAVVAYVVSEARWTGWKVTAAVFLLLLNTFVQGGIETTVYLRGRWSFNLGVQMPLTGLIISVLFAPLAVWVMGGFRRAAPGPEVKPPGQSAGEWITRFGAIALAFLAVYYLCGYYIAWQNPALRAYYSGSTDLNSFWGQIAFTWSSTPWMFPLQAGRGILWVVMTLPAISMLRGGRGRAAMGVALMYAVLDGSAMLLLPNPLMPPTVAHTHLVELAVSGTVFGAFAGWMMRGQRAQPSPATPSPQEA